MLVRGLSERDDRPISYSIKNLNRTIFLGLLMHSAEFSNVHDNDGKSKGVFFWASEVCEVF